MRWHLFQSMRCSFYHECICLWCNFGVILSVVPIFCTFPHITEWCQSTQMGFFLVKAKLEHAPQEHPSMSIKQLENVSSWVCTRTYPKWQLLLMPGSRHQLFCYAGVLLSHFAVQEHWVDSMHVNLEQKVGLWSEKVLPWPSFGKFIGDGEVGSEK